MATTERAEAATSRERVAVYLLAGLLGAGVIAALIAFLSGPPQMGADEEVFRTVDALFTAVTARDEKRLGECERRLRVCRDAGKLPPDPADYLDGVIARARGGRWESAAERLYDFMLAQRREGELDPRPKPTAKGGRKK